MLMSPSSWRHPLRVVAAVGVLVVLAACGASDPEPRNAARGAAAPLFSKVPEKYQNSKKIVVGSDIAYAPMEYYDTDGTTVLGVDREIADALGEQLGVTFEFQNASFDGLVTSLRSNRIDVIMSGMSDTKERQARVDFVDYYRAGVMLLVRKGNPRGLNSLADLCGRTVAVQRATTQADIADKQSKDCQAAGRKSIEVLKFDRETEALLQVKQGRAVAGLEDYPVAVYNSRTSGQGKDFQIVGDQIEAGPLGIAIGKDDTRLRDAIQAALQKIIENGKYQKILDTWEIPAGAVDSATVNAGT